MKKLLICKDDINHQLISTQVLEEANNIKYAIIDNPPEIENRPGEIGKYVWDKATNGVKIVYEARPKTQLDLIQEQLNDLLGKTMTLTDDSLVNMELNLSTDEKVEQLLQPKA